MRTIANLAKRTHLRIAVELVILVGCMYLHADAAGRQKLLLGSPGTMMATVTVTKVKGPGTAAAPSNDVEAWTVINTLDAETGSGSISHNMGANAEPTITPLVQTTAALSLWALTTLSSTAWAATKATTGGSGGVAAQLRVAIRRSI